MHKEMANLITHHTPLEDRSKDTYDEKIKAKYIHPFLQKTLNGVEENTNKQDQDGKHKEE